MMRIKILLVFWMMVMGLTYCTPPDNGMVKRVVCGDTIDMELIDSLGNTYTIRTPGPCDTILVEADSTETLDALMEVKLK